MRGGDIRGRTSFVILSTTSMKRNGQSATTYTLLYTYIDFSGRKAKINLPTTLKLTVFILVSSLIRSRRHLFFWTSWRLRTRHSARHTISINARNVINWKRDFKENIIEKRYSGERITKKIVIIRNESYFSAFHWGMKCCQISSNFRITN